MLQMKPWNEQHKWIKIYLEMPCRIQPHLHSAASVHWSYLREFQIFSEKILCGDISSKEFDPIYAKVVTTPEIVRTP